MGVVMRSVLFALIIAILSASFGSPAGACPPGYVLCGNGVCCPR